MLHVTKKIVIVIIVWLLFWIWLEYTVLRSTNFHKILYPEAYSGVDLNTNTNSVETLYRINQGRNHASQSSIVICGLARDIRKKLEMNIPRIEHIGKQFRKYTIIIFENDSTDGSRDVLKKWSNRNPNVVLLQCCDEGDCDCRLNKPLSYAKGILSLDRIERMAAFRNRYLSYVKQNHLNDDYMLVADLDLEGVCSLNGLFHSLTFLLNEFDCIAMNGRCAVPGTLGTSTMAYDSLAYLHKNDTPKTKITHSQLVSKLTQMNYDISTTPNNTITPVSSAFNGMALYNIPSLGSSEYISVGNCEHIGFHSGLKCGINKEWIGYAGFQGMRDFSDWY